MSIRSDSTAPLPPDDVPLVQAMLAHGADVEATDNNKNGALLCALICHHPRSAKLLMDHGANVNVSSTFGITPLMIAASSNDLDTTRSLLEHSARVTPTDSMGYTALHYAITGSAHNRIIPMLLAHGADPNARTKAGETPLRLAQERHFFSAVSLLRGTR